jgi:transcription-repair coupling factor (superfamily II helicase)
VITGNLMDDIIGLLRKTVPFRRVAEILRSGRSCEAGGLWGSSAAFIATALREDLGRPVLFITATGEGSEDALVDVSTFSTRMAAPSAKPDPASSNVLVFPAWETLPTETSLPDEVIFFQRLNLILALSRTQAVSQIIAAPVQAVMQGIPTPDEMSDTVMSLSAGQAVSPQVLAQKLVDAEMERVQRVEAPGQFCLRGGVMDIFPFSMPRPVRVEFLGDSIESLRFFDTSTLASDSPVPSAGFSLARKSDFFGRSIAGDSNDLLDHLPKGCVIVLHEPEAVFSHARRYMELEKLPGADARIARLAARLKGFPVLHATALPVPAAPTSIDFGVLSTQRFSGQLSGVLGGLTQVLADGSRVIVSCNSESEMHRFRELLEGTPLATDSRLETRIGTLSRGFQMPEISAAVIPHHELFNRHTQRRAQRVLPSLKPIDSFVELELGDHVVHSIHGIGRYRGIKRLQREGKVQEFLQVEFDERTMVFVPASQIELLQKYVGPAERSPKLSKVGTQAWEGRKLRVAQAVQKMAVELLDVQAMRRASPGIAYPKDTEWQAEFEAAFPFEDTEDQILVGGQIKRDMERPTPMDRLICGDVGYGKTELAMRAAFKAALSGKQVAVLVPTTVLAQQHYTTFRERMADYPVNIEVISRFKTRGEQRKTLEACAAGSVDILVGTHRLVQDDVVFKDLGLVIIDEEQRFGVEHKEHLKQLRATVDVLTLTATPIPRTLHMSLLGLREISTLATPPLDRRAIITEVCRYSPEKIRGAILRELNREGQVFFVHNRVENIENVAERLAEIVPEARFAVVHGQMTAWCSSSSARWTSS